MKQTGTFILLGLLLAAMPAPAWADHDRDNEKKEIIPFTDARLRIEVNATDGDSGLHALLDAEGWEFGAGSQ